MKTAILAIADALEFPNPHPSLIYAARYVVVEYDHDLIPDWIKLLANGNSDLWEDLVDEVRRWKKAEEEENASNNDNA